MFYERTPEGYEELDLKVLDMGMGHERVTWISNGTETSYESVMPKTLSKMKEKTGLQVDQDTWEEFLPYSSELNVDEVDDIDQKWDEVASKMRMDTDTLKEDIKPSAALYSVAEHTRALMFALADGKIPSNTGGGHNLRMIYRRAQDFIQKYNWNIQITQVAEWHAEELKHLFPELKESLDEIKEILRVEHHKYEKSREKAQEKLSKLDSQPSTEEMIELYESHGVSPEMMEENGFKVTEDFYTNLNTSNNQLNQADKSFNIKQDTKTEKLYYKNREPYKSNNKPEPQDFTFEADVIEKVNDEWIVLDRTMFYPEGGGQAADTGNIADNTVKAVEKQDGIVLHQAPENNLQTGDSVKCKVNGERRKQLTQHHSTTHMVNAATREILGNHIYQAGANKTIQKARLDLTHYEKPSNQKIRQIESHVQQIIEENHGIQVMEKKKSKAEQQHGFKIYQGGAPPGNKIRLIDIEQVDIEACGGTHLTKSSHAEEFVITGCKRIQDGVIRLEYKAGKAARDFQQDIERIFGEVVSKLFKDDETSLVNLDKSEANRDITEIKPERTLNLEEKREILEKMSEKFSVEIVDLPKTIQKFLDERKHAIARSEEIERKTGITPSSDFSRSSVFARARNLLDEHKVYTAILETSTSLFEEKKELKKNVDKQESKIEEYVEKNIKESEGGMELEIPTKDVGLLIQVAQKLSSKHQTTITLVGEEGAISASETNESAKKKLEELGSENVQGNDSFAKAFDI
jgi:alanyl-tRNA synthetase